MQTVPAGSLDADWEGVEWSVLILVKKSQTFRYNNLKTEIFQAMSAQISNSVPSIQNKVFHIAGMLSCTIKTSW